MSSWTVRCCCCVPRETCAPADVLAHSPAEIIDFGYPQNTETDTLKMYITTEGVKSERAVEDSAKITMQATGALSWRKADVKYRKNEAFVDVIEDVNLLMSATGAVLRADVTGQIIMRAYLSGTPECKFGLNDRLLLDNDGLLSLPSGNRMGSKATKAAAGSVTLEDCQFHQCVKLGKFDSDRIISFVPPDGEFELMRYRATENVNLPFKVHAIVNEVGKTKVEYSIGVRANFGSKLFATNVIVRIPTPLNTARITERCTQGKAKYEPSENNIVWKIGRFTGQSEFVLSAEAELSAMTNQKAWSRPPLSMNFSLLMFTSSGLLVRYLKVFEKSNYSSVKWVRYMTRAGSYEIRLVVLSSCCSGYASDQPADSEFKVLSYIMPSPPIILLKSGSCVLMFETLHSTGRWGVSVTLGYVVDVIHYEAYLLYKSTFLKPAKLSPRLCSWRLRQAGTFGDCGTRIRSQRGNVRSLCD